MKDILKDNQKIIDLFKERHGDYEKPTENLTLTALSYGIDIEGKTDSQIRQEIADKD